MNERCKRGTRNRGNEEREKRRNVVDCLRELFSSAARFGDLSPFGRLFEPFGDQLFDLAILKFGSFLGYFSKKPV